MLAGRVTDPKAVERAAAEFDQLQEAAFLEKYGFRKTRYVVVVGGKRYPAKALLAAAYGFQYPADGALQSNALSGGQSESNRVLRRLGFEIIDTREELLRPLPGQPRVWMEVCRTDRADRQSGPHRLGQALWSPKFNSRGGDLYKEMREVQPGDWVLHLTNNRAIVGRSRVAGAATDFPNPPSGTPWSDRPCQRVQLRDFEELLPPLVRQDFFATEPFKSQLKSLKDKELQHVFFTRDLELVQGAYLTGVPDVLLSVLAGAYAAATGRELVPGRPISPLVPDPESNGELEELLAWTHLGRSQLEDILDTLRSQKQLILFGPPGTGKTYVADAIGRYLTENPVDPEAGDLNERYELVQFHQSYGYEDFIQGIRPTTTTTGGGITYVVQNAVLMRLAERAQEDPEGRPHVLIIDEINRGNLARIFGELLLLLEYRGGSKRVRLPYSDSETPFTLPPNLYFIGTMNTADRSLAQVDYALRRRFRFVRLRAVHGGRAEVLDRYLSSQGVEPHQREEVLRLFVALNERISQELGEDFQVGHSYFMDIERVTSPAGRERLWRTAIEPLLDEYFHARKDRDKILAELQPGALLAAGATGNPAVGADLAEEAPD